MAFTGRNSVRNRPKSVTHSQRLAATRDSPEWASSERRASSYPRKWQWVNMKTGNKSLPKIQRNFSFCSTLSSRSNRNLGRSARIGPTTCSSSHMNCFGRFVAERIATFRDRLFECRLHCRGDLKARDVNARIHSFAFVLTKFSIERIQFFNKLIVFANIDALAFRRNGELGMRRNPTKLKPQNTVRRLWMHTSRAPPPPQCDPMHLMR